MSGDARSMAMSARRAKRPVRTIVVGLSFVIAGVIGTAGASAAGGWYLLIPPRTAYDERAAYLSGYKIHDDKPLFQWAQEGAYDSASECEAVRNVLLMAEQRKYSGASDAYHKALEERADQVVLKTQRWVTEVN